MKPPKVPESKGGRLKSIPSASIILLFNFLLKKKNICNLHRGKKNFITNNQSTTDPNRIADRLFFLPPLPYTHIYPTRTYRYTHRYTHKYRHGGTQTHIHNLDTHLHSAQPSIQPAIQRYSQPARLLPRSPPSALPASWRNPWQTEPLLLLRNRAPDRPSTTIPKCDFQRHPTPTPTTQHQQQ